MAVGIFKSLVHNKEFQIKSANSEYINPTSSKSSFQNEVEAVEESSSTKDQFVRDRDPRQDHLDLLKLIKA